MARLSMRKRLLFGCAAALLLVAGCEGILRLVGFCYTEDRAPLRFVGVDLEDEVTRGWLRPSRELFWEITPGARLGAVPPSELDRANTYGMRGWEPEPDPDRRVLLLGDSCTYALGVRRTESFAVQLEGRLDGALPQMRIDVINAGVPGYSTHQMTAAFRRWLDEQPGLVPDVVIVYASQWNDFTPAIGASDSERARRLEDLPSLTVTNDFGGSRVVQAIARVVTPLRRRLGALRLRAYREAFERGFLPDGPRVSIDEFRANLEAIAEACDEIGAEVFFLPGPVPRETLATVPDVARYRESMRECARARSIAIIETEASLREHDDSDVFLDFVHPTERGHALLGRSVFEAVVRGKVFGPSAKAAGVRAAPGGRAGFVVPPSWRKPLFGEGSTVRVRASRPPSRGADGVRDGASGERVAEAWREVEPDRGVVSIPVPGECVVGPVELGGKSFVRSRLLGRGAPRGSVRLRVTAEPLEPGRHASILLADRRFEPAKARARGERWYLPSSTRGRFRLHVRFEIEEEGEIDAPPARGDDDASVVVRWVQAQQITIP